MDKLKYIKLENEDGSYSESIPLAVDSNYVDVNGTTLTNALAEKASSDTIANVTNEINTQKARIDNLAQLTEGSTTGDAELIDIRTSYDGINYTDAGTAVREQIKSLDPYMINVAKDEKWQPNHYFKDTIGTSTIEDIAASTGTNAVNGVYEVDNLDYVEMYFSDYNQNKYYLLYDESGILRKKSTFSQGFQCSVDGYTIKYFGIQGGAMPKPISIIRIPNIYEYYRKYFRDYNLQNSISTILGQIAIDRSSVGIIPMGDNVDSSWQVNSTNYNTRLPDLNTASINKIYSILQCGNLISHWPEEASTSGTLITFNGQSSRESIDNKAFTVQLLIDDTNKFFYRSCWRSIWEDWKKILYEDTYTITPNYSNISGFDKIGIIGDSLSQGAYRKSDGTDASNLNYSWPKRIADQCNNTVQNFGFGGAVTTSWIERTSDDRGLTGVLKPANKCDAYIFGLGYNDDNPNSSSGGVTLGSMEDIDTTNPDNNEVSYYGNVDKIIRKVCTAYPNAHFFVLTNPYENTQYMLSYNQALRDVVDRLKDTTKVYLIDLYALYKDIYIDLVNDREGNHYHIQTYAYMAMLIATAISNYMRDNYTKFKYINE